MAERVPQTFSLNEAQLRQALQMTAARRPDVANVIRDCCGQASGTPVRVRSGVLTSTIGFALDANGQVPNAQLNQAFFVRAQGDVDPVLGLLGPALTTLLTPGKTNGGTSFIARRLGVRPLVLSFAAGASAAEHAQALVDLATRSGMTVSLNTNDQQQIGSVNNFPGAGYGIIGAPGNSLDASAAPLISDAAAGLRADPATVTTELDDELLIGPNATLRVNNLVQPQMPVNTGLNGALIALQLCFYGSELAAVPG